jgi:serine/threonine-protein kinase
MSPEQAMGEREITARSDVYALGAVLYEMLVGEPPFTGPTAQAIVARVMTEQPRKLTLQRKTIPPYVEAAVQTALEKLPADRFASAHDFADALAGKGAVPAAEPVARRPVERPSRLRDPAVLLPSLVAVAALAAAASLARRPAPKGLPPIRFVYAAPDSAKPSDGPPWPAAISPDGAAVVYSVAQSSTNSGFYLLRTDQLEAHPIPGTTGAYQPYFSPDGAWLAFEQAGKERKVRLDGSAPVTITEASSGNGVDWTVNNEIVIGANGPFHGLSRVSAAGGEAVEVTRPDTTHGERDHLWPIAAADGKTIVFVTWSGSLAGSRLAITSLDDGKVVPLGIAGIRPLAILDGMLVYVQADGTVMAVKLDTRGKKIDGRPIPVHDPVQVQPWANGNSGVFISRGGALVASRGGARGKLTWVSRDGHQEAVLPQAREFQYPRLSPDERRIAIVVQDGQQSDVWIYDRSLSTFSRLTSAETVTAAEWNAAGTRIVFTAASEARSAVWSQIAAGGSPAEKLFESPYLISAVSMSPDGKWLLVQTFQNTWDIFRVRLDSGRVAEGYLTSPANELAPTFSPDGKWAAVVSDESGRPEVYVRSFPDPSSRVQISVSGGGEPVWSRDGTRLFYRSGSALLAARVSLAPTFTLLARDTVVPNLAAVASRVADYDMARDGRRVLAIVSDADDFQLVVSPNWITELRRRVAESGQGN